MDKELFRALISENQEYIDKISLVALHAIHPLRKAMIVTYEDEDTIERDGLKISVVPVWKWVLE